jgi:hypothetical protein
MMNINTHRAYAPLRDKRAQMRSKGQVPTGVALASTLVNYSERGQHYVDTLNSIMSYNKLAEIDEARLVSQTCPYETTSAVPVILTKEISAECIPTKHSDVQERCGRRFTEESTVVIRKPSEMSEAIVKCSIGDGMGFAAI